jgi:hypothetical protein
MRSTSRWSAFSSAIASSRPLPFLPLALRELRALALRLLFPFELRALALRELALRWLRDRVELERRPFLVLRDLAMTFLAVLSVCLC